ncbi:MAG: hypothetical protein R3293_05280 [Candidatus Promineifilaceae bacterium]|nr:hypothetical protein [Candidatus Promineifilaceae bacterium]
MLHLTNDELILGEIDQLPDPSDQFMIIHNPRQPDGTDLTFLREDVTVIFVPWHQTKMVQVLPKTGIEEVIGFVRE